MSIENQYLSLLESSYTELRRLESEVTQLEDIRKRVETLVTTNGQLPKLFVDLNKSLEILAENYIKGIKDTSEGFVSKSNNLFITNLVDLEKKLANLKKEIDRLVNTDFTKLFKDLQKVFIDQTRADLAVELKKFDAKLTDLQSKIGELKKEITRLEKIDLEKHFRELQTTLSNIFNAVNGINATLTNVTQTLNGIVQSINAVQTSINGNHTATTRLLNGIEDHLRKQDTFLENKIKSLLEQNQLLKSEIKTNRAIQIVGLILTLGILIYIAFGKYFPIIN